MSEILRRTAPVEIRAKGRKLEGYAATFGSVADLGDFDEVIHPGAFASALTGAADILALVDHDPGKVLARTRSGTLRLGEDATGLSFSLDVPDTQAGRDALALAERGDLGGMSFGFRVPQGGERWAGRLRELRAIDLFEISVVQAFPAYGQTSVHARAGGRQPHATVVLADLRLRLLRLGE